MAEAAGVVKKPESTNSVADPCSPNGAMKLESITESSASQPRLLKNMDSE